jgi:hypothetical protein
MSLQILQSTVEISPLSVFSEKRRIANSRAEPAKVITSFSYKILEEEEEEEEEEKDGEK